MAYSVLTSKGQITIPATVRKRLHLKSGDRVDFRVREGQVVLVPLGKSASDVFGLLSGKKNSVVTVDEMRTGLGKVIGKHGNARS